MSTTERIKKAVERTRKALTMKPALGLGTGISRTTVKNGFLCEIQEGNWKLAADMPEAVGGSGQAPTPGVYGRAALGSCLAIGYMLRAAALNIEVARLEVEVQADYDDGGLLATSNVAPGYSEVRYLVTIEAKASEEEILKMLDEADEHSPYLDVFMRAQTCKRDVHINSAKIHS